MGRKRGFADPSSASWVVSDFCVKVLGSCRQPVAETVSLRLGSRLGSGRCWPDSRFADDEVRKVARDAYVAWQGSRYSVRWPHVGREVAVRQTAGQVEVRWGGERIAVHARAERKHAVVTCA